MVTPALPVTNQVRQLQNLVTVGVRQCDTLAPELRDIPVSCD